MNSDEYTSRNSDSGVEDAAMSPTRELRPGEDTIVIGPYLLIHRIGVGGMGDVVACGTKGADSPPRRSQVRGDVLQLGQARAGGAMAGKAAGTLRSVWRPPS